MKISFTSGMTGAMACTARKLLCIFLATFALLGAYAANISSTGAGGNWNAPGSWSPAQVPVAGDIVTIVSGSPITINVNSACAAITINSGGVLNLGALRTINISGNFTNDGTFTAGATSTVIFSNSTNCSISGAGAITFVNLTITTSAGAGVTLGRPVTATRLTLNSGVLSTDPTNILSITSTAATGITAGAAFSSTNMINGPVRWTLATTNITYIFPVGAGTTYLPLTLYSTNTAAGNIATVQAFNTGSGGLGLSVSTTEYWSLSTSASLTTTGTTVNVTRPTAINPYNLLGRSSTTAGGVYTSLTGVVGANGITSTDIGVTSPWFFAFATGTITTGAVSGSPFCAGATGISVPFTYFPATNYPVGTTTFTAQMSDASGSFASPSVLQSVPSDASGTQSISVTIPSVSAGTGYRIRVVSNSPAVNGTNNGTDLTVSATATVATNAASSVGTTDATLNGTVSANSVSTTVTFNYGTTTGYGSNATAAQSPVPTQSTAVNAAITGLTPNTLYHFRVNSNNGTCTAAGADATFTTLPLAPVVGTPGSATSSGFTANWSAPVTPGTATYTYTVQASTDPAFGSVNVTGSSIASGTLSYVFNTLSPGTTYYFRVMAVNATGNSVWSAVSSSILTTNGTDYYNTGNVPGNLTTSWTTSPTGVGGTLLSAGSNNFTSGDVFHIRTGTTVTTTGAWAISGTGATLDIIGTLTLSHPLSISGTFSNNGTFNNGGQTVTFGTGGDIAGTNVTTFCNLTINTTNTTDIVTLTRSGAIIRYNGGGGILTLTKGIFRIGAGNIIYFENNSATNGWVNNGGDLATTGTNGADGGKVVLVTGSGANFNITGGGVTHFYDFSFGTAVGAANRQVVQSNPNTVVINGTLTMQDNQSKWITNSPAYGSNSTLYVNNNGLGYTPGAGNRLEWMAMGAGTIGTTAGYPNNVTLVNVGISVTNGCGFAPTGTWCINGTLSIGDGTATCFATLESMTAFTCGGVTIDNGSTLKHASATFTVKGNWRRQGASIGTYSPNTSASTIIFGGSGTSVSPQTISVSTGTETFGNSNYSNITVNNGTYVKLNSPVTLGTANIITLTSGILETSTVNILSITNTAVTGITGSGSSTTYINGPVKWNIALASKYTFPLGKGASYLPFDLTPSSAASNTITAEAFNTNSGGAPDGTTVNSISNTEYWSVSATGGFSSGINISAARTAGVGSFNMLAKSSTANGIYSSIGGSTGTVGSIAGISNGGGTGSSPWYVVLAYGPLNINVIGITYPGCSVGSTGSITVAGSGGTPPYEYNINGGGYQSSGTFSGLAAGFYTMGVRDASLNVKTIVVELAALVVTSDTGTCAGGSIQLQASHAGTAWSYSWSPATGLSSTTIANPVATPASTTTYTLSALLPDVGTNLLTNGGFESATPGFTSGYFNHTCSAYNSSWDLSAMPNPFPCNGNNGYGSNHTGIYKITNNAINLCVNLSNTCVPRTGTGLLVVDGPASNGSGVVAWGQSIGVTVNTNYIFTYWVRNAFNGGGSNADLRTFINGSLVTGTATYPNPFTVSSTTWTQVSYLWNSGASTTANIEMYNYTNADVANDYAIDDMSFYTACSSSKSVTVAINATPTLNIVSQSGQACIGQGATISLTGLTPVDTFTVNYTINGVAQTPVTGVISDGSFNASFTTAALTAANNGQTIQITSLTNTGGHSNCTQTFTGKTTTLSVNPVVTWLNTVTSTTDWHTASNWCGGIPTATTDVSIPDYGPAGKYPIIAATASGFSNNISISNNASVTINNTGTLTLKGSYSSGVTGTLINNGELIFSGSSATPQSFPGSTGIIAAMNNLTVNNSSGLNPAVTFNRSFFITGTLTPTQGIINVGNVSSDVFISLISTATGTASVAQLGASSFSYINNGQFIVQRYYPARRGWRLVTAPVTGAHTIAEAWQEKTTGLDYSTPFATANSILPANDTTEAGYATHITGGTTGNGFDQGQRNNPSIKYYVQGPPGSWPSPLNTHLTNVNSREGWMLFVRGDRKNYGQITDQYKTPVTTTLRPRGQLYTGPKPTTSSGLTVIGNPYASAIDYMAISRTPATPLLPWPTNPTYYVWDPYLGGSEGVGAFVTLTWNSTNSNFDRSAPLTGSGTSTYDNRYIASGAAIMVDFPAGGTLTIEEDDKNAYNTTTAFRPLAAGKQGQMRTVLSIVNDDKSTDVTDGTLSYFNNEFNNDADVNDARKLGNFNENIVIEKGGKLLSIERRKLLGEGDTVYFGLYRMQQKNYELKFIIDNAVVAPLTVALLEDTHLKTKTPVRIKGETKIPFSITADVASAATNRFRLVFSRSMAAFTSMNAIVRNSDAVVEWKLKDEFDIINRFDIERSADGVSFAAAGSQETGAGLNRTEGYTWADAKLVPGKYYYRIKGTGSNGEVLFSDVASVEITKRTPSMNVSPNPVTGNSIRLQMSNIPTGVYQARLYNGNGKVVLNKKINHNETSNTENIKLDKTAAKGIYHLEVTGPGNYSAKEKVIIN